MGQATLVARDNATRERLNAGARDWARATGRLGETMNAPDREFAVGDRVVTRRNDRFYYVDNGTRGAIRAVDPGVGGLWVGLELGGSELVGALGVGEDDRRLAGCGHVGLVEEQERAAGLEATVVSELARQAGEREALGDARLLFELAHGAPGGARAGSRHRGRRRRAPQRPRGPS